MQTLDLKLDEIKHTIDLIDNYDQILALHNMGGKIFLFMDDREKLTKYCQQLYIWKSNTNILSFCGGKAGANWIFTYLYSKNIINKGDYDMICTDDHLLKNFTIERLKVNDYDFLHAGIGTAWYLLSKENCEKYLDFFYQVNEELERILFKRFRINPNQKYNEEEYINLGISHGFASILKYYLECYKKSIHFESSKRNANKLLNFYKNNICDNGSLFCFPSFLSNEFKEKINYSRLAWCYGDISIGYLFNQAGFLFKDKEWIDLSMDVLLKTTLRKKLRETGVLDGGICHGASGLAYIYHKLYLKNKRKEFQNASNFWLNEIYKYRRFMVENGNVIIHYPQFNNVLNVEINNHSFLEGTCGVGVVLNSIKNGCYDWDYSLMLND